MEKIYKNAVLFVSFSLYIYLSHTHTTVRKELLQEVFQKQESFLKFLNMELAEWFQQKFCLSLSNTHTRERERKSRQTYNPHFSKAMLQKCFFSPKNLF